MKRRRDVLEREIMSVAPEWLTDARSVETELAWLAKVVEGQRHGDGHGVEIAFN